MMMTMMMTVSTGGRNWQTRQGRRESRIAQGWFGWERIWRGEEEDEEEEEEVGRERERLLLEGAITFRRSVERVLFVPEVWPVGGSHCHQRTLLKNKVRYFFF